MPFGKYEVEITCTKELKNSEIGILKNFNTWDKDDVESIEEIINERANFSLNRHEL
ncbi:MAG: hypothetical protein LBV42_00975 [Methanobrevibacter sp.]|nr:hypothetical protein [Methanobrevibacter sp.]